jgi:hypothetical protein
MSYKEELKHRVASVLCHTPRLPDEEIKKILHTLYTQALEESKLTGQSISSISYEILEGLEECYHHKSKHIEQELHQASMLMAVILYESAQKNIKQKEKKLQQSKAQLIDTIEMEILHLLESIETFESYAEDKSHRQFKQSLSKTKSDILDNINTFKTLLIQHSTS